MRTIYKYPIRSLLEGGSSIEMPEGAKILFVGLDPQMAPCVWAEVDPAYPMKKFELYVHGTGHDIRDSESHVGSWVQGPFVWHLYRVSFSLTNTPRRHGS